MIAVRSILLWSMLFICAGTFAQQKQPADTAKGGGSRIIILDNEAGEYLQTGNTVVHKLLGHVKLLHGSDTLYCDSAFFYTQSNSVEAFGDVAVLQADGTEAYADYMRYTGDNKKVYMRSDNPLADVKLYDGKTNTLYSRVLDYDMNTKIGRYSQRGFLETGTTTLESNYGQYNLKTKDARFRGDVEITDPEYKVVSSDLTYNTETEITRFLSYSIISNDKSVLYTSSGTYDARNRKAHFTGRSSMFNEDQYIEGDTLDYDRNTGFGFARGAVIAMDTAMKTTLYCGYVQYNEQSGAMLAYIKPLMKKVDGEDSLYIKADTFYTAKVYDTLTELSAQDSLQKTVQEIYSAMEKEGDTLTADTIVTNDSVSLVNENVDSPGNNNNWLDTDTLAEKSDSLKATLESIPVKDEYGRDTAALPVLHDRKKAETDSIVVPGKDTVLREKATLLQADTMYREDSEHRLELRERSQYYNNTPGPSSDTAASMYFIGYHNVLIYSDSLQGKCDSIWYAQSDSTIRMYRQPLLWPQKSQLKGDRIYLKLDSSKLKEVFVPRNAIMITRSGPEQAGMFDQIQGGTIRGYLRNNQMDSLIARPEASSIYFIKDDDGAYVGASEAKSEKIEVWFDQEAISKIYYRVDVEQKTTPMADVVPDQLRLSRFSWEEELRPKSLAEFLQDTTPPMDTELLQTPRDK